MDYNNFLNDIINKQSKKAKLYIVLKIIIFVIAIASFVTSCFFISDKTIIYLSIANVILVFISLSFIYYTTFGIIIPINKQNIIFKKIVSAEDKNIHGEIMAIKKHITIENGVICDEVVVLVGGEEKVFTVLEDFEIELTENNNYLFNTRLNYLLGAEDEK